MLIPVEPTTLLAFAVTAFAIVVSPGPDTILILQNSAVGGRKLGLFTVAGVQFGLVGHTILAVAGLSLIVGSYPFMFEVIAILGAIYLAWLAVRIVRSGVLEDDPTGDNLLSPNLWRGFMDAFLCNILNPKVLLIYFALMPNFVLVEMGLVSQQLLILGIVLITINTVWQVPLSIVANGASRWLKEPRVKNAVSWIAGSVLMLFAVGMIYEHIWSTERMNAVLQWLAA